MKQLKPKHGSNMVINMEAHIVRPGLWIQL
ncbi:hypothetical protein SAMN05443550_104121 [Pedobacter hartonius]|uniref:Uncharacterized protein n=1 Tax=Pedobacter hartonius TaxID=425514 RepID=A0A1H4CNZ4_9SPHI|nr:hypothetical protein SAMN05443550_104121 [Pedobacter hartonius]